jgi:signal transduction histidine kinase/ActR/RegA family two-component response regulator
MAGAARRLLYGSVNIGHDRTLGIQARLMMLAFVTALPLVVLAGVTAISLIDAQDVQLKHEVAGKVNALQNDIDRQISAIQVELEVLAKLPSIQSGDLITYDRQLRAAIQVYGTALVLHDTQGHQLINTNRPFGAPLPSATNKEMHDRVVATGRPQVSDLIIGATLRRPIISVGVPVLRGGHVAYVLAMGIGPEIVSQLLKDQNLLSEAISPAWTIAILDRKGIILARNRELDKFLGKPVAPLLRKAMMSATEDTWILNITSDGTPVYSTFRRSATTGWTVAIGIPREFVDAPVSRAWRLAVGGGVLFMALSLALAFWMAQGIRRPVHKLAVMTRAMGGGQPVGLFHSGVRELNLVGDGLRDAAITLAHHREHLEDVVSARTRELKQAQETLLQSQKMEAIGQLTGGIAHDFNNLLTVAWGSLEMLEPRISDEKNLRLLRSAQSAMSRGAKLTESLLAFARKQHLQLVRADLNSIIVEMTEMLRRSIGPRIEIRHAFAADLWPVLIDIAQIETALLNIAINARDAMPKGGKLLIQTANISNEVPEEIAGCECVLVSMHDTGTGMSPEIMERAFEPFFTTKEIGKGTGLGLSMVFGVVRQSGGAVRLCSWIGGGTTVQVYLPRVSCAALPEAQDALPARARTSNAARILVVDDDPGVRRVTVECLQEVGYSVLEADSGRAALALLERGNPFDLVVMDQVMPGLSGHETARLARRASPGLKVLFISGYAGMDGYATEAGHDSWLAKPFRAEVLVGAVSASLHHVNERV